MYIRFWPRNEPRRELDEDAFAACTQRARIILGLWRLGDPSGRSFTLAPYRAGMRCAAARIAFHDRHRDVSELEELARVHHFELEASRDPIEGLPA